MSTMSDPRYDPDFDDDDYDLYRDGGVTSVGLPPSQLALVIGVNAVISLIISVVVVLIANRQVIPGDVATPASLITPIATVSGVQGAPPAAGGNSQPAAPTEAPPTEPTPLESVDYEVQAGDTLSQIANKFSVSLFDLMLANGLTDQDFIQVGQELVIPLGGLPTITPTFTPEPLPTNTPLPFDPPTPISGDVQRPPEPAVTVGPSPTPTPTAIGSPGGATALPTSTPPPSDQVDVVINDVVGTGILQQETLTILNKGPGTSLFNWKLVGSPLGNFVFPDIFLFSGGSIRIHTAAGQNTPSDLYLGQEEVAWPPGTTIVLQDADGTEVSTFSISSQ